jgi:pimeloyl-ACP methyl ester carboxylesterase
VRCFLLDRPGTGLSAPLVQVPDADRLADYVSDLTRDVLDALELPSASVVGCSFGGFAALRSALSLGDRVERVVLAGCPAFVPGWRPPRFFSILRAPVIGRLLLATPPTRASVRLGLRELGHGRSLGAGVIPAPMLEWVRAWQRDTDTMRNDAAMILACGSRRDGFDPRLDLRLDELAAVKQPCLVLSGSEDPVGGEDVVRSLAGMLPSCELEVWPGAGHLPWLDDPEAFGARIVEFVGSESSRMPLSVEHLELDAVRVLEGED